MNDPTPERYFVSLSDGVEGPYDLDFIEAMVMSEIYSVDVLICREGSEDWKPLGGVRLPPLPEEPVRRQPEASASLRPQPAATLPKDLPRKLLVVAGAVIVVVIIAAAINSSSTPNSAGAGGAPAYSAPEASGQVGGGAQAGGFDADAYLKSRGVTSSPSDTPASESAPATGPWDRYGGTLSATPAPSYVQFQGKTYEVSQEDDVDLERRQVELEAKEKTLDASKSEEQDLSDEIERDRTSVDTTDQNAVDQFNAKVNRYNALNDEVQQQVNEYNSLVDSYNAELVRVGTPVR